MFPNLQMETTCNHNHQCWTLKLDGNSWKWSEDGNKKPITFQSFVFCCFGAFASGSWKIPKIKWDKTGPPNTGLPFASLSEDPLGSSSSHPLASTPSALAPECWSLNHYDLQNLGPFKRIKTSWWFQFNPFEKYVRQNGKKKQMMWIKNLKKRFELPPSRKPWTGCFGGCFVFNESFRWMRHLSAGPKWDLGPKSRARF